MPAGSPYQTVNLPISGQSYQSRTIPISSQRSLNMYPEATQGGISPLVMHSWPGLALIDTNFQDDAIFGCYVFNGTFYAVSGTELRKYSYDLSSFTVVGNIAVAYPNLVSFSDNGQVMLMAAGSTVYQYDGTTLSTVPTAVNNPTKVQFLNERFYINGNDGGVAVSDVLSTNFDSGNTFYGRSTPQKTIVHHIFNQIIYLFDENSIEPWQPTDVGAPPASRINQGIIENVGCKSPYGIANTDKYMYFVGSDSHVYRVSGFSAEEITNPVIASHFRTLDAAASIANFIDINGHKFIIFEFRNNDETWVFCETSGAWFEVEDEQGSYQAVSPVWYINRWLCGSSENGAIFEFDTDYALNGVKRFTRERVIATISGDDIGKPGVMLEMSKLRISMETGTNGGFTTVPDPEFMIIPSFDGGYTWSKPIIKSLGRRGSYTLPIEYHNMKQFRRAVFKIRCTDLFGDFNEESGSFTLFSASIDIREVPY